MFWEGWYMLEGFVHGVTCVEVEVGVVGLVKLVLIYYELLDLGVTTRRTISRVFC